MAFSDAESFKCLETSIKSYSAPMQSFAEVMRDVKKLYLSKLTTPAEEELSRERELTEIEEKLVKARAEENLWSEKLARLRREREQGREARNDELQKLKSEIEKLKKETEDQIKRINDNTNKKSKETASEYSSKIEKLRAETKVLAKDVNELRSQNKDAQDRMLNTRQKLQTGRIEDNIREYDKRMYENTEQLDRESKAFDDHKKALEMLADHISQLRMEQKRMAEEEERDAQKRKDYEMVLKQKSQAAEFVAAHWKGLKARQEYEKLKKTKLKKKRRGK